MYSIVFPLPVVLAVGEVTSGQIIFVIASKHLFGLRWSGVFFVCLIWFGFLEFFLISQVSMWKLTDEMELGLNIWACVTLDGYEQRFRGFSER